MAADKLSQSGIYFDELNKVRIWDPEAATKTNELRDVCRDFVTNISDFNDAAKRLITIVEELSKQVDQEKMKALGSSNLLMSMAKERETQRQQFHALILEKTTELERLRIQHQSLLRIETEQQQLLDQLRLT